MVFSNNLLAGSGGQSTGYEIENSLRFNDDDSAFLARTPGASNRKTWTFSCWVKRASLFNGSVPQIILSAGDGSSNDFIMQFGQSDDTLRISDYEGSTQSNLITTQLFRDVGAWYHFVLAYDTTQGTAANRIKLYVNGSQVTAFGTETYPSQNNDLVINSAIPHNIGRGAYSSNGYFDGYLAEINFIDGTALTPTSFGEFNSTTGQWVPINTSGLTFGNNGFYLEFKDSSFIGKSTHQATGNEEMIPQDAGTITASTNVNFSTSISFDNVTGTNYPTLNQWRLDAGVPDTGAFIGKDYGADNTIVATGFKVYPSGDYGFDTWTNASSSSVYSLQLQGSNDGTNYTNIGSAKQINGASSATEHKGLSNSTAYRYVRLLITGVSYGGTQQYFAETEVEFFGVGTYFNAQGISTADQMTDSPTNNFCVLSPIDKHGGGLTLSDGNLRAAPSASEYCNNHGTFYINSGKWVFECKHTTVFGEACGWSPPGERLSGSSDRGYFMFVDGRAYDNTTNTGTKGASLANGDFRYVFYDADAQAMWFAHVDVSSSNALVYDNSATKAEIEAGTTTNAVFTNIPAGFWAPGLWMDTQGVIEVNFGQSAFTTTSDLPSGFNTLKSANLPDPTIEDPSAHFQTTLYSGNSSTQEINQSGNSTFEPGWVWIKPRNGAGYSHQLFDQVRGATKRINSDAASAETTTSNTLTSFDSDGFSLGSHVSVNESGKNMVAWQWKANGSGSSNSDGSVTSTVSNNSTANFSIVKYTGTGSGNSTVGHGLGTTPTFIILKHLGRSQNWRVFHNAEGVGETGFLNDTAAWAADPDRISAVSSTTFTAKSNMNESADYIAYCFADVEGYSNFGSFVGNGNADGPFVPLGFKPAFLVTKNSTSSGNAWPIADNQRSPFNLANATVFTNFSNAETTGYQVDLLSNGFKARTTDNAVNKSGDTIVYWAFAETPFKTSNAR